MLYVYHCLSIPAYILSFSMFTLPHGISIAKGRLNLPLRRGSLAVKSSTERSLINLARPEAECKSVVWFFLHTRKDGFHRQIETVRPISCSKQPMSGFRIRKQLSLICIVVVFRCICSTWANNCVAQNDSWAWFVVINDLQPLEQNLLTNNVYFQSAAQI